MSEDLSDLELTTVVEAIRSQLTASVDRSAGQRIQFELGDIELEFAVTVTQETKGSAGVKVWVASANGTHGKTEATAHRIKLTLKPQDTLNGRSPHISDGAEPNRPR
ncbi:trypco2 family protein [Streptomyces sp. NPDC058734]|uniref:trypco2 family protein n=1 Tax=Streptomyces sp. NPDC058734 TaxID=3346615 RepID=UPI0036A75D7D